MSQPLSRPLRLSTGEGRVPTFSSAHAPALKVRPGEVFTVQTADRFAPLFQGQSIDATHVIWGRIDRMLSNCSRCRARS